MPWSIPLHSKTPQTAVSCCTPNELAPGQSWAAFDDEQNLSLVLLHCKSQGVKEDQELQPGDGSE